MTLCFCVSSLVSEGVTCLIGVSCRSGAAGRRCHRACFVGGQGRDGKRAPRVGPESTGRVKVRSHPHRNIHSNKQICCIYCTYCLLQGEVGARLRPLLLGLASPVCQELTGAILQHALSDSHSNSNAILKHTLLDCIRRLGYVD